MKKTMIKKCLRAEKNNPQKQEKRAIYRKYHISKGACHMGDANDAPTVHRHNCILWGETQA
jgi:hypothetical protein